MLRSSWPGCFEFLHQVYSEVYSEVNSIARSGFLFHLLLRLSLHYPRTQFKTLRFSFQFFFSVPLLPDLLPQTTSFATATHSDCASLGTLSATTITSHPGKVLVTYFPAGRRKPTFVLCPVNLQGPWLRWKDMNFSPTECLRVNDSSIYIGAPELVYQSRQSSPVALGVNRCIKTNTGDTSWETSSHM